MAHSRGLPPPGVTFPESRSLWDTEAMEALFADFPDLEADDIRACIAYAALC